MKKILSTIALLIVTQLQADQYILIMSKDDKVCQHMGKLYNTDLRKKGVIALEDHEEYNWLKWDQNITFTKDIGLDNKPRTYKKDTFDINNDGKDETVLFKRSYYNWRMDFKIDDLTYFFNNIKIDYSSIKVRDFNLQVKPTHTSSFNGYKLKELSSRDIYMETLYFIRPFSLNNQHYLSFFGNIGLNIVWNENNDFLEKKNGIIITKYDAKNTLNDICYFVRPQTIDTKTGELK